MINSLLHPAKLGVLKERLFVDLYLIELREKYRMNLEEYSSENKTWCKEEPSKLTMI